MTSWTHGVSAGLIVQISGVEAARLRVQVQFSGSGLRVQSSDFRAQGSGFRVEGSGVRAQDEGLKAPGSGIRECNT